MKRLLFVGLVFIALLVGNLLIVRREEGYKSKLNEAVASITPGTVKDGVVLGCKVVTLQRRDDYPAVIIGKTVPQIRDLILAQRAAC